MKAAKIVSVKKDRVEVPRDQAVGYIDDMQERLRLISVMISMALLADDLDGDGGFAAMTCVERYDYLHHMKEMANEAKDASEKVRYVLHTLYNQSTSEAANNA